MRSRPCLLVLAVVLGGCDKVPTPEPVPPPKALTRDATGHYCGMTVADHAGPKGQVFVAQRDQPLWFTSVRDTIAFTLLPEELSRIRAIYVTDMARAETWAAPDDSTWMPAAEAVYVIGSAQRGGMGAQEAVPFSGRDAAQRFVERYGGHIVALQEIPRDYILGDAWNTAGNGPTEN